MVISKAQCLSYISSVGKWALILRDWYYGVTKTKKTLFTRPLMYLLDNLVYLLNIILDIDTLG
ncbi:MAG: hypothetical protein N2748_01145, partial [candidate division WOR-3 bacterium]|nr:hypothetical protein [candidate division WOR-3 bacterium]